jgi:hypothetical protein
MIEHETNDGRIIPLEEMELGHIYATRASLLKWVKAKPDEFQLADLRDSIRALDAELQRRGRGRRRRRRVG